MKQAACLTTDPSKAALRLAGAAMRLRELDLPKRGLVFDMHGRSHNLSASLAHLAGIKEADQIPISGGTRQVLETLCMTDRREDVGYAIAAFELHHAPLPDLRNVLEETRRLVGENGVVLFADYALLGWEQQVAEACTTTQAEQGQIEAYGGFASWFTAHAELTRQRMEQAALMAGFFQVESSDLPAGRAVVLAYGHHTSDQELL